MVAPEVLVLDVDEPPGPLDRLGVAARDAALAAAGERVVAAVAQVGVGPQQLDDVRAALDRRAAAAPARAAGRASCPSAQPVLEPADRAAAQRGRVLPPLAEDGLDVVHRRTADRRLDVVPRRGVAVLLRPAPAPAGRRGGRRRRGGSGTGRCRRRTRCRGPGRRGAGSPRSFWWCEPPVRTRMSRSASAPRRCRCRPSRRFSPEVKPIALAVRAPDQPADVDAALVGAAEHLDDLAARLAGQPLVGVALPVGEEHQVAGAGRLDPLVELGEVRRPVDQRPDQVALRPGLPPGWRSSSRVPGLPRSALVSSQSVGSITEDGSRSGTCPGCLVAPSRGRRDRRMLRIVGLCPGCRRGGAALRTLGPGPGW